jgi:hypothetical protein
LQEELSMTNIYKVWFIFAFACYIAPKEPNYTNWDKSWQT